MENIDTHDYLAAERCRLREMLESVRNQLRLKCGHDVDMREAEHEFLAHGFDAFARQFRREYIAAHSRQG